MEPEPLPLPVWPTAQRTFRAQRTGRYLPASTAHPAKMLPAIARHAITAYTAPGDLILDPMCGIGTTLMEAVHLGRQAIGIEYEPGWADLARRNRDHAATQGATGKAQVFTGDSRGLANLLGPDMRGQVALAVTSPPYGPSVHGQVTARPGGVAKRDYRYSRDRANLAHVRHDRLLDAFATILTVCAGYLRPDGIAAITARPWRRDGVLVELPAALTVAAQQAGQAAQRRAARGLRVRPARRAHLVLPAHPDPQGPRARHAAAGHRPRRRPGVPEAVMTTGARGYARRAEPTAIAPGNAAAVTWSCIHQVRADDPTR